MLLQAGLLEALGVPHAFTTRLGGVSAQPFDTLNLGRAAGDDPAAVRENRARALAALGRDTSNQVEASQVHGREIAVVNAAHRGQRIRGADGLTSRDPSAVLAMHCADCAPVLVSDPTTGAVAAVHTGWRGTASGAASAAIRTMGEAFGSRPEDLVVAIGPAIGPCCYEVGGEVVEALAPWPWQSAVLRPSSEGRWFLDLWEANRRQIESAGVPPWAITTAGLCTACHPDLFFSHRRSGRTGRMAALIAPLSV